MPDPEATPASGLSAPEAARRLQADGPNELAPPKPRTAWHITRDVAREPMFQLLLAAGLLYLVLGNLGEALMLLAFVALTAIITVVQEHRTERALEALRDLTNPRATVLRDAAQTRIAGREVVQGDLLVLIEGDRVAADARVLSANDLQADESMLTGEAVPVAKAPGASVPGAMHEQGEGASTVYAGTLLVSGAGLAYVVATGARSEIGRIGRVLGEVDSPASPLNLQTRRLVRIFAWLGLALSVSVVGLYGVTRGDWLGGLLAGITLAMSMLPQEFLLILTVFMAMGAWRLSQQRVLARRAATIETLGSATVLCTDKTGTLTLNQMAIVELAHLTPEGMVTWAAGSGAAPTGFHTLLEYGILASEIAPFDPMDKAFLALGRDHLPPERLHADWTLTHEYGLTPELMAMTHLWQSLPATSHAVAIKGAPEGVAALCRLSEVQTQVITQTAKAMAGRGLRVLAVAKAWHEGRDWPATPAGFDFEYLGLVALADPLREGVPAAVQECRSAGIRVVMITGDHPATAMAIAAQAGLDTREPPITGPALDALSDADLRQRVAVTTVFARVKPQQKLRIVQALKLTGAVVAMTGDGVNDAPSLKAAHIGIAMGRRGTDVAREASSLVLLDDDFGAIVHAVRLGRRIYDNLLKAMAFVLAVHVPIAGLSLLPLLLGLPLVFTPVHIAFLELLIDPVCAIVFEAEGEEADVMARPPRDPGLPLFSVALIASSLLQGVLVLLAVGGFYVGLLQMQTPEAVARAATFATLVLCSLALAITNRSLSGKLMVALQRPNPALWRVAAATLALLAAVLFMAPLRRLFHFAALTPDLMGAAAGVGLLTLLSILALQRLVRAVRESGT